MMPTRRSFYTGLAAMSLAALASVYASGQQPAVKIPEPGVPQVMTLEGKFVRAAYNNEGYVILGYQIANRTVGEDWVMLDVGITLMEKVPTYELKRDALSLDTPDGTVALPSIEEYRDNESQVQRAPEPHEGPARLDQLLSPLDDWREPARVLRGPRVARDALEPGRCHELARVRGPALLPRARWHEARPGTG